VQSVADSLGLSLAEAASGIATIAEYKMADIIRKMTVEKGHDPRDFVLFAFGGAGPVHAAVFGAELGVRKVIVPLREIASTWCAFGAAAADILHVYEQVDIQGSPFDPARVNRALADLQARAEAQMAEDGIAASRRKFGFSLDMRHRGQIHEVEVMLPEGRLGGDHGGKEGVPRSNWSERLRQRFYDRYERLYGRGSSYRNARLEIVTMRVRATAATPRPKLTKARKLTAAIPEAAERGARPIYWAGTKRTLKTPIFDGGRLRPGNRIKGPCVVETSQTNVVVPPGRTLRVDAFGNFEILFR
jgi:N-methylhydantoinase A